MNGMAFQNLKNHSSMDDDFESIEFDIDDIVRSGLVRNYLLTKLLWVCNV